MDYIIIYRNNIDEYELLLEFRKMNQDNRKRLEGYARALLDIQEEKL